MRSADAFVDDLRERSALGLLRGVIAAGEDLLGEAQRRAPLDEGTLRASAALAIIVNGRRLEGEGAASAARDVVLAEVRAGRGLEIQAEVSFNTIYAARQHEETDWVHPRGGQAKYLESVLAERGTRYAKAIQASALRAL